MAVASSARQGDILSQRYTIHETIAVGGSGTVFRGVDAGEQRQVAIKVMHAGHPEGDKERRRFAREAAIIQKLVHPNIVRVLDHGHTEDGLPFLVFPLLEGRTLDARLKSEGKIEWPEVGRLAMEMLSALERAHEMGVAHRDIKPANIFLVSSVLGDHVQMLDFGLAKIVFDNQRHEVTKTGSLIGTPRYMAPEQVRGEQVSEVADIYSFGLVMCDMLLGHPLVRAKRELEIYAAHGSDKELELPVGVMRSPFAGLIQRAVAKKLEVRYRKAHQMLADLRAIVNAGEKGLAPADMEATFIVDPALVRPLSLPTEGSERLRTAFNQMADADEPSLPEAPPTLVMQPPAAAPSMPLLLTRKPDDMADTMRMKVKGADGEGSRGRGVEGSREGHEQEVAAPRIDAPQSAAPDPVLLQAVAEAEASAEVTRQRSTRTALVVVALVVAVAMLALLTFR